MCLLLSQSIPVEGSLVRIMMPGLVWFYSLLLLTGLSHPNECLEWPSPGGEKKPFDFGTGILGICRALPDFGKRWYSVVESGLLLGHFCTHYRNNSLVPRPWFPIESAQVVRGWGWEWGYLSVLGTRDGKSEVIRKVPLKGERNRRGS